MTQYKRVAIDTSKSVFTIHCIDSQDHAVFRTNPRRGQMKNLVLIALVVGICISGSRLV